MSRSDGAVEPRTQIPQQSARGLRPSRAPRHALPPAAVTEFGCDGPPRHALPETPGAERAHPGASRHTLPRARIPAFARDAADRRIITALGLAIGGVAVLVALVHPLPAWCAAFAIAIRLGGGAQYAAAVARRKACPNLVTWFLWGLTPMIAVAAQYGDRPGPEVAVTFVLGLGPLVVTAVGFCTDRSASKLTPFTLSCAAASLVGILLWQITAVPALAIAFCIVADLLATLPTLQKAYRDPDSEYAPPYLLSVLAMLITVGTVAHGDFIAYGFPLYMLVVNVTLFAFAALPLARIVRWATVPRLRPARPPRHGIPAGLSPR
jgi:hypothetical protein